MRLFVFVSPKIKDLGRFQRFIYLVRDVKVTVRDLVAIIMKSITVETQLDYAVYINEYLVPLEEFVCDVLREDDCINITESEGVTTDAMIETHDTESSMKWIPIQRHPVAEEWICYKTKETDYLTGQDYWSTEFKVSQVLWVDYKLRENPIFVVREGLDCQGAFDTIELTDITDLHCCTSNEAITSEPAQPNRRMEKVKSALRRQIEWYLSPVNLKSDTFLINAITENSFHLPVDFFLTFPRISDITDDLEILTRAISTSKRFKLESGKIAVPAEIVVEAKKLQFLDLL